MFNKGIAFKVIKHTMKLVNLCAKREPLVSTIQLELIERPKNFRYVLFV